MADLLSKEKIILAIEDEVSIIKFLRTYLEAQKFYFLSADTAEKGLELAEQEQPQLILLDLGLPDLDGLEVIKKLRQWTEVPIIVLSARGQERDKVLALDLGADDYLTKPFSVMELSARIRVALRHASGKIETAPIFINGELKVDLANREVFLKNEAINLTPTQFDVLAVLVKNAGKIVTRQQLLKAVWGESYTEEKDYLRIYIHQLRHKLEENPAQPQYIRTESGVGYRLQESI